MTRGPFFLIVAVIVISSYYHDDDELVVARRTSQVQWRKLGESGPLSKSTGQASLGESLSTGHLCSACSDPAHGYCGSSRHVCSLAFLPSILRSEMLHLHCLVGFQSLANKTGVEPVDG